MKKITKRVATYMLAIAGLTTVFTSCNEENEEVMNRKANYKSSIYQPPTESTQQFALKLTQVIAAEPSVLEELNMGISEVVSYGMDENLSAFDILNTSNSKFITQTSFTKLKQAFDESMLHVANMTAGNYYRNLNIYWGYHDEWDYNTLPVICYIDQNTTDTETKGYKISTDGSITEVIMTVDEFDDYFTHPCIVVNFRDIPYTDYPSLRDGQRSKGKTYWPTTSDEEESETIKDSIDRAKYNIYTDSTKLFRVSMSSVKSNGVQYDYFWAGGSEIKVISLFYNEYINTLDTCINIFELTRKQIHQHKKKYFSNSQIHPNWTSKYESLKVKIVEMDAGSEYNFGMTLPVKIGLDSTTTTTVNLTFNVKLKNNDDDLGEKVFYRNTYITYGTKGYNSAYDLANHLPSSVSYSESYYGLVFTSRMTIKDNSY